MSRERRNLSTAFFQLNLVITLVEVNLREELGSVELDDHLVDGWRRMSLPLDRLVGRSHVYAETHLRRVFWFRDQDDRGHPRCGSYHLLDDVIVF